MGKGPGAEDRVRDREAVEQESKQMSKMHKPCYGKCSRCVWRWNGGCSEWQG